MLSKWLGLSDSESEGDCVVMEEDSNPPCKKRRLSATDQEPKPIVHITPQKAIGEEINFQKVQANYAIQMELDKNQSLLLKFLEGSDDFLKSFTIDRISAAGEFIRHQVNKLFTGIDNFSEVEKHWLEVHAEYVVRILHRIQSRQYVLNPNLTVPQETSAGYFYRARKEMIEARAKEIEREADKLHASRVRKALKERLEFCSRKMAEQNKETCGSSENKGDTVEVEEYDARMNMMINQMKKLSTTEHGEYSQNPEYNDICGDVVKKLMNLRLKERRRNPEPEFAILSSPPRTPSVSRSTSPQRDTPSGQTSFLVEDTRIFSELHPPLPRSLPNAISNNQISLYSDTNSSTIASAAQPQLISDAASSTVNTKIGNEISQNNKYYRPVLSAVRLHDISSVADNSAIYDENERSKENKHVRISNVHPVSIQLFSRISENDRVADHAWQDPKKFIRKRMFNDNGSTSWFEELDFERGAVYLSEGGMGLQAGTREFIGCRIGPEELSGNLLPVNFLLSGAEGDVGATYPWPLVTTAVANQFLPAYPSSQPLIKYILPKNKELLNGYFKQDVFQRLCNFQSKGLGSKSIVEYRNRFNRSAREMLHINVEPEYNKLMLTDSILGLCNPNVLLNTGLLVCYPRIEPSLFVNQTFKFVRKLLSEDLSSRRAKELVDERIKLVNNQQEHYLPPIYFENELYEKKFDFDVSGGVFLSFGQDVLFNYHDLKKNIKNAECQGLPELQNCVNRLNSPRYFMEDDPVYAAVAECISLTNKVIYELSELWNLMDWWSARKFPDIWLITMPVGINGDPINLYNRLIKKAVCSSDVFPISVKLIDWEKYLRRREENHGHRSKCNELFDVEERLAYLFHLMRYKADVGFRRSQDERVYAINQSYVDRIPGEFDTSHMFKGI